MMHWHKPLGLLCLFTFCLSPGQLDLLALSLQGEAAVSCLGLGLTPQTHWS